uniref:Metalloendopeptidase n=1 Tax=Rondotia menciana TaxID=1221527 RepID=X5D7Z9_9NEOP|nr:hatching protein [Rondotia menciana]AID50186.1 hatching enzyme [Rondotia menciana]
MLRVALFVCAVGCVVGTPIVVRTKDEIQAFRSFLENTKSGDSQQFITRALANPFANPEENSGKFQGDIVLDDSMIEVLVRQYAVGRNAYIWPDTKWPNDTVVWEFGEGEFNPVQQAAIEEGIKDIERHTCVKFRYRQPEDTAFVRLTGGAGGCYAHVGYSETRGVHLLNLARNDPGVGCFRHGTIVHEWMHILGFLHMQSTYNRDNYVKIVKENIIPGLEHNFAVFNQGLVDNLDVNYDYVSCLHYGPHAFSQNGQKTIEALQEHEGVMGQRLYVTDYDWLRINRHYGCEGAWN